MLSTMIARTPRSRPCLVALLVVALVGCAFGGERGGAEVAPPPHDDGSLDQRGVQPGPPDGLRPDGSTEPGLDEAEPATPDVGPAPVEDTDAQADAGDAPEDPPPPPGPVTRPVSAFLPAADRLVAIGDVHGDMTALRAVLTLADVIDGDGHWTGGETVVVQVGDQTDRGDEEREVLHWLEALAEEARAAGGAVYPLLGNHETMNVELDFRYVTEGGWADFADVSWDPADPLYAEFEPFERPRVAAFRPGGPYAALLAPHAIAVVVGGTAFVHGGLLPEHVAYGLDAINEETTAWMLGETEEPAVLLGEDSPEWSRHYSDAPDWEDCLLLDQALEALPADRLVVGHTVQSQGITGACGDRVWRVDVGLAAYYGGPVAALEILGDVVRSLP